MTSDLKIKFFKSTFMNFHFIAFVGERNSTHFGILFHLNLLLKSVYRRFHFRVAENAIVISYVSHNCDVRPIKSHDY